MRVRLLSLLDAPYAFSATYTESIQHPAEVWAERAERAARGGSEAIFLAHAGDEVVAMAGAYTPADPHTRVIWGVWVEPGLRGQTLGSRMVETVVLWAERAGADRVELWVTAANEPARALYEGLGFRESGETRAMESNPGLIETKLFRPVGRGPSA